MVKKQNKKTTVLLPIAVIFFFTAWLFLDESKDSYDEVFEKRWFGKVVEYRYAKMVELIERGDFDVVYDQYYSPESKKQVPRSEYIEAEKIQHDSDVLAGITYTHHIIDVYIDGDIAYVDRILAIDHTKDEDMSVEYRRGYEKFVKVGNKWFYATDEVLCLRKGARSMPREFTQAIDLIVATYQKSGDEDMVAFMEEVRNCLNVSYTTSSEEYDGISAAFEMNSLESLEKIDIVVNQKYIDQNYVVLAILLVHELTHVDQNIRLGNVKNRDDCYDREVSALIGQSRFLEKYTNSMQQEHIALSRISDNHNIIRLVHLLRHVSDAAMYREEVLDVIKGNVTYQNQCKHY